jgi:hypothetical protein
MEDHAMDQTFPISPPGANARRWFTGLALLMIAMAIFIGWLTREIPIVATIVVVAELALAGFFLWMRQALVGAHVAVSKDAVEIVAPLYGRRIAASAIIPGSVRSSNMTSQSPGGLRWRTNGLSVPGYQLGWFSTHGGKKALVASANFDVLAFDTRDGFSVMLGVEDAAKAGAAVKRLVGDRA